MDRERRIRERAHEIWESEGRPHGREHEHWARAQSEVDGEDGGAGRLPPVEPDSNTAGSNLEPDAGVAGGGAVPDKPKAGRSRARTGTGARNAAKTGEAPAGKEAASGAGSASPPEPGGTTPDGSPAAGAGSGKGSTAGRATGSPRKTRR